jgi:hypothetical protein
MIMSKVSKKGIILLDSEEIRALAAMGAMALGCNKISIALLHNKFKIIMDYSKITNIAFDGIDHSDFPEFCDAYIVSAEIEGEQLNSDQIDELNEDREFVYEKKMCYLYYLTKVIFLVILKH